MLHIRSAIINTNSIANHDSHIEFGVRSIKHS